MFELTAFSPRHLEGIILDLTEERECPHCKEILQPEEFPSPQEADTFIERYGFLPDLHPRWCSYCVLNALAGGSAD